MMRMPIPKLGSNSAILAAAVLLGLASGPAIYAQGGAQTATPSASLPGSTARPVVSFAFERPGLSVPKLTLRIAQDGAGTWSERAVAWALPACVGRSVNGRPLPWLQGTQLSWLR